MGNMYVGSFVFPHFTFVACAVIFLALFYGPGLALVCIWFLIVLSFSITLRFLGFLRVFVAAIKSF